MKLNKFLQFSALLSISIILFIIVQASTKDGQYPNQKDEITDTRDGKIYKTVKIGEQIWTAYNLAYLPMINCPDSNSSIIPHYYVHGYKGMRLSEVVNTVNYKVFGVLYNWKAAINACPEGWHLPSDDEWKKLEIYLGMNQLEADSMSIRGSTEGDKLKSADTRYWGATSTNPTNESGFSGLPGGTYRYDQCLFTPVERNGVFWTSTERGDDHAWGRLLDNGGSRIFRGSPNKKNGYSVRCIRDE